MRLDVALSDVIHTILSPKDVSPGCGYSWYAKQRLTKNDIHMCFPHNVPDFLQKSPPRAVRCLWRAFESAPVTPP